MIDAHAHISSSDLQKNVKEVVIRARRNKVFKIVDNAIDLQSSKTTLENFLKYPDILIPTIGIHPEIVTPESDIFQKNFSLDEQACVQLFEKGKGKYRAVGECGLDYYWLEKNTDLTRGEKEESKNKQRKLLDFQIDFAISVQLPLIIHSRGAEKECFDIIKKKVKNKVNLLFHCFTGDMQIFQRVLESGYFVSFNNILSYPSADNVRKLLDFGWKHYQHLVLTETDAPLLPPQERRGQQSEPSDVASVVSTIAEITHASISEIDNQTSSNASLFYNLK
jgi:TatD DNase family protein